MIGSSNIIACIWDFDNVLISSDLRSFFIDNMELPRAQFEHELTLLPQIYAERGIKISLNSIFLNHLISYADKEAIYNLNQQTLKGLGQSMKFYSGVAKLLNDLRDISSSNSEFSGTQIVVKHYIIAEGLAEIIRNTSIAHFFSGILGSELVDTLLPPSFESKLIAPLENATYKSVGQAIDVYGKVGFLQKLCLSDPTDMSDGMNKGHLKIKNSFSKFVYIGNGFKARPCFDWVQKNKGKCFSVYDSSQLQEFEESDSLLRNGQIDAYGPANYDSDSNTSLWLKMHVRKMCEETLEELAKVNS